MRIERVVVEDTSGLNFARDMSVPLDGLTVVLGRNGSGKSRLLEFVHSVLSPEMQFRGRQARFATEPRWAFGYLHLRLTHLDSNEGDWPWLRSRIASLDPTFDELADIPDVGRLLQGWQPEDGDFDSEAEYLRSYKLTMEDDRSWPSFRMRLLDAMASRATASSRSIAALVWALVFGDRDELDVSIQGFGGGALSVVWSPSASHGDSDLLAQLASSDRSQLSPGLARVVDRILEPGDHRREVITLGASALDDEVTDILPTVIRIHDDFRDPGWTVDAVLEALQPRDEQWVRPAVTGELAVSSWVVEGLTWLEEVANRHAPEFVLTSGRIEMRTALDGRAGEPRTLVGQRMVGGEFYEWMDLGAGTRRWIAAAVESAAQQPADDEAGCKPFPIYLIDEPELHLHPTAQASILRWLEKRVADGAAVLLATHSPLYLDVSITQRRILGLVQWPDGTELLDLSPAILRDLDPRAGGLLAELGLDRASAVSATRGVFVVEGMHDQLVLEAFYGQELDRERIRVLPIRGTTNAMSLAEGQLFALFGVPMAVMFDHTRPGALDGSLTTDLSGEERKLAKLVQHFRALSEDGFATTFVTFDLPDIITALPEELVSRAFPAVKWRGGWKALVEDWENSRRPAFKSFALKRLGITSVTPDSFLRMVLARVTPDDHPHPGLRRAVAEAISKLTESSVEPGSSVQS